MLNYLFLNFVQIAHDLTWRANSDCRQRVGLVRVYVVC